MSEKHIIVQGATCKCKLSEDTSTTDKVKVKSQTKHFANDKEGAIKLIATTKEIGQTLEKNTFGKCKNQPAGNTFLPCMVDITEWKNFYEKVILSNQGKILLEDSTATCSKGVPSCIEIKDHGQIAEPSIQNFKNADPEVQSKINPILGAQELAKIKFDFSGIEQK